MVHLTYAQRESLKKVVLTASIQKLTISETQAYIKDKLDFDMSLDYIWRLKSSLRKDSRKQLSIYQKDKFAYMDEVFFKRVEEYQNYQNILYTLIANNKDKPEAQVKAVAEISKITESFINLFQDLPAITRLGVDAFPPPTTTATATTTESPDL